MKLFRDYAILAAGQVIGKVAGFVAFAWLARALGPAEYGAVEYVVGLSFVFAAVVEGGFGTVAVRRVAHAPALLPRLAAQIPWARLVLALLSIPGMVLVAMVFGHRDVPVVLVVLFALALLAVPWRQEWLLQARERMADAAWVQLVRAVVFALLVVWWVRDAGEMTWVGVAEVASALAATAYCFFAQHRYVVPFQPAAAREGLHGLIAEGMVVALGTIVFTVQQYVPLFLAPLLAGTSATAWFAGAMRITSSLLVFSFLYHYSLYPAVTRALRRADGSLGTLLDASFRVTMWAGALAAVVLALVAGPVVRVTFGPAMAPAGSALAVLAWALPIALCSGHARWALAARGAQGSVLKAQIAGLLATIATSLAAGRAFGAPGLACASLVGVMLVWGVAHRLARASDLAVPAPTLVVGPAILAAVVIGAVLLVDVQGWWRLAGGVVFGVLAPVVDRRLLQSVATLARAKADVRPRVTASPRP